MNPFTANHKIADVASNVRAELYVIGALLLSVEICADSEFKDCENEAATLIAAARERLALLLAHAENTAKGMADESGAA